MASAAAAMCVEREGAMESVPRLEEVRERMASAWPETLQVSLPLWLGSA